jgi:hypothetical protein
MDLMRFEPAQFSLPELHFLLEHVGEPPVVALRRPIPAGANPRQIKLLLDSVYEHEQLRQAEEGYQWAGIESLTDAITRYLEWHDRSREIARRGVTDAAGAKIFHPSMYVWDDGRAFRYGVDADSSDMVRSEILEDGSRKPFGVTLALVGSDSLPHISDIAPWIRQGNTKMIRDDKIVDEKSEKNKRVAHLRCTICDETQSYDPSNQQSKRIAHARMVRHVKTAKVNVNRHRILLSKIAR